VGCRGQLRTRNWKVNDNEGELEAELECHSHWPATHDTHDIPRLQKLLETFDYYCSMSINYESRHEYYHTRFEITNRLVSRISDAKCILNKTG